MAKVYLDERTDCFANCVGTIERMDVNKDTLFC